MFRRFLVILVLSVWFGGFTFYAVVVIPTGIKVLHSHMRVGLVTQEVTRWLNLIGLVAFVIFAWNVAALRKVENKKWFGRLAGALGMMILLHITLCALHPILDSQIVERDLVNESKFYNWHRVYLIVSTAQWLATLVYLWASLKLWKECAE
ncbi:MAG: hypothetical protein ACR2H1_03965 [Limisphaerales bacterium]